MFWPYSYNPYIWPALLLATLTGVLAFYGWLHRSTPGGITFILLMSFSMLFAIGNVLQEAASSTAIKITWFEFNSVILPVIVVLGLCFAIEYAGLERWLTPLTVALLIIPPLLLAWLVLTNDSHHLVWTSIQVEQAIIEERSIALWFVLGFGYFLSLCHIMVLVWLWVRSPRHRWPAVILILAVLISRGAYLLKLFNLIPVSRIDLPSLTYILVTLMYALVFIRFRIFSVVPIGRTTVIERMSDGVLVLDAEDRVADLNPVVEKLLNKPRAKILGMEVVKLLPSIHDIIAPPGKFSSTEIEVSTGEKSMPRCYQINLTPLTNRRGFQLGRLVFLHDITDLKGAQKKLLQSQKALAILQERERVARELHDELSQELAFINSQAQAAHKLWASGQLNQAGSTLLRLAEVARETYTTVRQLIAGLLETISPDENFLAMLHGFIGKFGRENDIQVELVISGNPADFTPEPTVGVQLLRILQEAFNNIRKHSRAQHVRVNLAINPERLSIVIEDDGIGFEQEEPKSVDKTFGLKIMRDRAIDIGGTLQVSSKPGHGTCIFVQVPRQIPQEVGL